MASKEATVFVVDVGAAMGRRNHGRDVSDLDWSLDYVWDRIASIVATERKTAHVGVVAFKTDGTDNKMGDEEGYQNISVLRDLGQVLMPDIRQLQEQLRSSHTDDGDFISALIVAIEMIETHCKKLQYARKVVLITNALTPLDAEDTADVIEDIIKKVKSDNMELVVLGVDFDDPEYGFKEEGKPKAKADNEALLRNLADGCDGVYGTLAQAIDELSTPRIKSVRPVPSYKGYLTLGSLEDYDSAMAIDVERYPKVMVARAPTASSFVIKSDLAPHETQGEGGQQDGLAGVKRARTYQIPDESAPGGKRDVDEAELARGYAYGSTAVFIEEANRNVTTFETVPGLEIIGFVAKEQYEPYMDMSRSNVILASRTNDKAVMALSSLIHALYELESYAVARFVPKPDKAPVMLLLSPSISPDLECLYDVELPFAEDVRQYRFPPLDRIITVSGKTITQHRNLPSQDLQDAMSAYVDAMDLSSASPDSTEYATIDETFSPMLHRINQIVRHRAIHPSAPLPPIPEILTRFSHPPSNLISSASDSISALAKAADIKRVPPRTLARRGARQSNAPKPLSGLDVDALLSSSSAPSSTKKNAVDPKNPIPSYRQALAQASDIPQVRALSESMAAVARDLVTRSTGDALYARAIEVLGVMRGELLDLEDAEGWNDIARDFKRKLFEGGMGGDRAEFWFAVRAGRLGLIKEKECQGGVGEDEAKEFLVARR